MVNLYSLTLGLKAMEKRCDRDSVENCFYPLERKKSILLMPRISARICIFIKPFDEEVFRSLYKFVKFIQELEKELGIDIELICHENLTKAFYDSKELLKEYNIEKNILFYTELREECKKQITYIVTFGGDGTILYAAK